MLFARLEVVTIRTKADYLATMMENMDETLYAQMWQMKQGSMHPSLSLRIYQHLFEQTKVVLPKVTQYPFFSKISDVVTPQGQK